MPQNAKNIDDRILFVMNKLRDEYEVVKLQGFPARNMDVFSRHARRHDVVIPDSRWRSWAVELGIDNLQLEAIFKILENEGLLEEYKIVPDYI